MNQPEDIGSVQAPIVFPVVAALLLAQFALASHESPISVIASFVPLIAPFVMFTRLTISSVPAAQLTGSIVVNIIATVFIVLLSGRVYRLGMLLYSGVPSPRQLLKNLR